jgi:hypothetical protein
MSRDVPVHVDGARGRRPRVQFAVDRAADTGPRQSGLHVTQPAEAPPRYEPSLVRPTPTVIAFRVRSFRR